MTALQRSFQVRVMWELYGTDMQHKLCSKSSIPTCKSSFITCVPRLHSLPPAALNLQAPQLPSQAPINHNNNHHASTTASPPPLPLPPSPPPAPLPSITIIIIPLPPTTNPDSNPPSQKRHHADRASIRPRPASSPPSASLAENSAIVHRHSHSLGVRNL